MVMSILTALKKVLRSLSLSIGGLPRTLVMERSVVFVGCAIIAVFVKKSTRLVACTEKRLKCRLKLPAS